MDLKCVNNEMDSSKVPKIKWVLSKFLITSIVCFFLIFLFAAINLEFNDIKEERASYLEAEHKTISQLLFPALQISDTEQIRHLLNLASQNGTTFGIINQEGDIILPDYENSYIYKKLLNIKNQVNCNSLNIKDNSIFNNKSYIYCSNLTENDPITNKTHQYGVIVSLTNVKFLSLIRESTIYLFLIAFITLLASILIILSVLKQKLLNPLTKLEAEISYKIQHINSTETNLGSIENAPYEIKMIKIAFEKLLHTLQEEYKNHLDKARKAALFDQATQIAHDIRSPLATIDMAISDIKHFPEEKRILLRCAINRIHDIANGLLHSNKMLKQENLTLIEPTTHALEYETVMLSSIINSITSEKRTQYRSKKSIEIISHVSKSAYGVFSNINKSELKRVLSNLINNAVESIQKQEGVVKIELSKDNNYAKIEISDNGIGIPEELLSRLGREKISYNKISGNGLGLFHAFTAIERMNGFITIDSTINFGTTITIKLPEAMPPKWFMPILYLENINKIIILDDDITVHNIWNERFKEKFKDLEYTFSIEHFTNPNEFEKWINTNFRLNFLLLCDYEFVSYNETGLDIIKKHKLVNKSILVTSHYDSDYIQNYCLDLGIKLIPKDTTTYIPIEIKKSDALYDAVLIDDDHIIRTTWEFYAVIKSKKIKSFSDPSSFISDISSYDKRVNIYIDSNLNKDQKGEDFAKYLYQLGFVNIFITTGYDKSRFSEYTFLKGIINKEPPADL